MTAKSKRNILRRLKTSLAMPRTRQMSSRLKRRNWRMNLGSSKRHLRVKPRKERALSKISSLLSKHRSSSSRKIENNYRLTMIN